MHASPTDPPLLRRIADGEPGAAEELLAEHLDGLWEFVHYRVGGDRSAAEDVVQETFLVALQRAASFEGRSDPFTWLCGIAKNLVRERRRERRPVPLDVALEESSAEIDAILADVARSPLPDWVLERKETTELVGATLSSLPPDYRRALLDKYVDGMSTAELATRAGRGAKAAESLLQRARASFARVFELLARRRGGLP